MTSKNAAPRQDDSEVNPKIDPAPDSNTEKEPDDWISGDAPMTGAHASHLEQALTKAEASKRINALRSKRKSGADR